MIDVAHSVPAGPLRGELEKTRRMEMLQDSYLRAVAAAAGCTMAKPDPDNGIDWTLSHTSNKHETDEQIDLKLQLKSTWTSGPNPANGFVSVNISNDRLKMLASARVTVHRILVAMIVPEDVADWIEASHDIFQLRHCAYWRSVTGVKPSGIKHTSVRVSTDQIFDDDALCGIMERIGKGGDALSTPDFSEIAGHLTDSQLALALERSGWQKFGGQAGLYSRWRLEADSLTPGGRLLLPQDAETDDYRELLTQAVARAWNLGDAKIRSILQRAATLHSLGDEMKFHKEARTRRGTIPWNAGEDLHAGARKSMAVAAKTRKSKAAYFGNSNTYLAKSFLDSILMGQTEVGSYVVTAYAPSEEVFSEKKPKPGESIPLIGQHTGREITLGLVSALEAARESVDHFVASGSTYGFIENVNRGFCYELTQAVRSLIRDSDGAEVEIELNSGDDIFAETSPQRHKLEFSPSDYSVLERAGTVLAAAARPEPVTVLGMVTLLERPKPGNPGVVRLDVLGGTTARKMRVRLKVDDYDLAVDAHRNNFAVRISGRQELEGHYYWLYDPEIIELVNVTPQTPGIDVNPENQTPLF